MKRTGNIRVVADEAIPFMSGVLEHLTDLSLMQGRLISRQTIHNADALIVRTRTVCNSSLLGGTRVKFIATATIGFDHIDTAYCRKNGILFANAPGCNAESVKQYLTAALIKICIERGIDPTLLTLGVIGAGHTGSRVASSASALGMRVLINDPPRQRKEPNIKFSELKDLAKESDILTLHVPLTMTGRDGTFHLAGKELIASMKRGSWLINTSRGGVTDEYEVKRALWSGQLGGYVADVWSSEPAADNELIAMSYLATPHIAGYSADGKLNGARMVLEALAGHFSLPLALPDSGILPVPPDAIITLNPSESDTSTSVLQAISRSYDIEAESRRFKSSPGSFEEIRNNYPLRREFHAYKVSGPDPVIDICRNLGFRID